MKFKFQPGYLALALFVLAYVFQVNLDTKRFHTTNTNAVKISLNDYIEPQPPSPQAARLSSFGATEFLADWYWLKTIQYYGGGDPSGKYRKLGELFQLVTDLSPKFSAAYKTGLLILPGEGFTIEALALGAKGQEQLPTEWELPYYTGLVWHVSKKDYTNAAIQFERAATLPGAPDNAKLFAGIYYKEAGTRQTAYQIFKTIYETSTDDFTKERARKYVEHLNIQFFLEDAVTRFRTQFGRLPSSLDELVAKKIIETIPKSPLERNFTLDPATGTVSDAK